MKLFIDYVYQRRRGLLCLLLFILIFSVSFGLYHLPLAAVLYPTVLCILLGCCVVLADFLRIRKRHQFLERVATLPAAMITTLPAVESIEDADYQKVIRALQREVSDLETRTGARFQDMMEYYTMWAHQIKTPIASMKVTLQNEDSPLSRRLSTELFHIEQYVDMVLAFLRLDSDSTDYVFREQDLDGIVRQSVVRFAGEFIDRKLSLNCPPLETTVVTDEKWLSFVLEQLLSNALKYTRKGGISISLQPAKTLCIADTGIGIAPEDLPRVFEKGYTGLNGRADKRASGLGLYLCRQICHRLGIELRIESQVGEGTRVFLDLEQYDLRTE